MRYFALWNGASHIPFHLVSPAPSIDADKLRITQVLWNLLRSAVKFTAQGGSITVRSHAIHDDRASRLVIELRDTGIGIEPEEMNHVFKTFEQGGRHITRQF